MVHTSSREPHLPTHLRQFVISLAATKRTHLTATVAPFQADLYVVPNAPCPSTSPSSNCQHQHRQRCRLER